MLNTFLDESGTSGAPHENISVIAGFMIPQSLQDDVSNMVARIVSGSVPEHYRQGFVYHTTELLNSKKFRDRWPLADRLQVIYAMMGIPRYFQCPVVWSAIRKDWTIDLPPPPEGRAQMSQIEARHSTCFINCVGEINRLLEEKNETGHLVVERCESMNNRLNGSFEYMRLHPPAYFETTAGRLKWANDRINTPAYFFFKEHPLLQVADACAFGVRSALARTKYSPAYARAIAEEDTFASDFTKVFGGHITFSLREGMSMPMAAGA